MFFNYLKHHVKINKETFIKKDDNILEKESPAVFDVLDKNVKYIQERLNNNFDVKVRILIFGAESKQSVGLIFIDGISDRNSISKDIIRPITECKTTVTNTSKLLHLISHEILWASECKEVTDLNEIISSCLKGECALFINGCTTAIILDTKGGEKRNITEPESESVVRGPREGFTENSKINTALIRRKIRSTDLIIEDFTVGRKTHTQISILYLQHIARPDVVNTIRKRIKDLDVESILESGYIEQFIEDQPLSIFPTVDYSEKPDVIAGKILEGRVAIVVDGTPFVLTAPMLFIESFQTAEDYYNRPVYASTIRIIRYVAYFLSVFGPAMFIALTNFHQELVPTKLLISVIKSKEGTPFPAFIETFVMVLAFEFLREAGIRLPKSVGQAVSIVGALIMGEAAVSAGIVGAPVVIVIAFAAVCGFLLPVQNNSSSILRLIMMVCASLFGWFGISMALFGVLIYLATLKSFGVPYFDSASNIYDLKDTLVRVPIMENTKRPVNLAYLDKTRISEKKNQKKNQKPKTKNDKEK